MKVFWFLCLMTVAKLEEIKSGDRIVNGQIAEPHSIPFQVAMLIKKSNKGTILCGGSVINEKFILTAGHCLKSAERAIVIIGGHDLTQTNESEVVKQSVTAENFRIHPHFNIKVAYLDIALLLLPTPLTFTKSIQPVKMPSGFLFEENFAGEIGTVSGFGQSCDSCGPSHVLRFTLNRVLRNEECEQSFGFNAIPSETQICLSTNTNNSGNCRGDSGGPVTIQRDETPLQIGLSSFGYRKCEEGQPTVFTRLTRELVEWINEEVEKNAS